MTAHDAALVKAHPRERLRRHSAVALALFALLFTLLLAVIAGFGAAMAVVDRTARVLPDYERIDLAPYLAKESYTEEDYDVLYHQTGLARTAVDALEEKEMLLEYQEAFFYEGVLDHYMAAPTTPRCMLLDENARYQFPLPENAPILRFNGMEFVYGQYEIAPYAAGMPSCILPYDSIRNLVTVTMKPLIENRPIVASYYQIKIRFGICG